MGFGRRRLRGSDGVSVVGSRAFCSGVVSWDLPRSESWFEPLSRDLFILEDVCVSSCCVSGSGLLFLWAFGLGGTRRLLFGMPGVQYGGIAVVRRYKQKVIMR